MIAVSAAAEGAGLEPGWWGHLIQLAVLAPFVAGAGLRPRIGGPLLILLGIAFTVSVVFGRRGDPNVAGLLIVAFPGIASGASFTLAGLAKQSQRRADSTTTQWPLETAGEGPNSIDAPIGCREASREP